MAEKFVIGKTVPVERIWLNSKEACEYMGCKEKFLKTLRDTCKIRTSRLGTKTYLYDKKSIDKYIQQNIIVEI